MTIQRLYPRRRFAVRYGTLLLAAYLLAGCGAPSALQPHGPASAAVSWLSWVLFATAGVVVVVVFGLLGYALYRRRDRASRLQNGSFFIGVGGALIPALILIAIMLIGVGVQAALATPAQPALTLDVTGHQWWWEVRYPDQGAVTANEIHVPVGKPVLIRLTSADVIHSFWIPQLQVKTDLIPGKTNTIWLQADQAGEYRGQCAEYCGLEHAHMAFIVVADPPEQFDAWLANQARAAADPSDPLLQQGKQVFLGSACVYCHAIRGTDATGAVGPDLTHLASRNTLGAGTLPNTRGNLAGWIVNSQTTKPGNRMPPMYLDSEHLQALLAYLESLK